MYGQPSCSGSRGRGRQSPAQQAARPRYFLPNNHYYRQTPNSPTTENPNVNAQNLNFDVDSQIRSSHTSRIDEAVVKARRELIAAGENVSSYKVSKGALGVASWPSLGVEMQDVPSLARLIQIEEKVNAYIIHFIDAWRIATLSDLETEICKNEGIEQFEELELGPLIRHPSIDYYYCVRTDTVRAYKISGQEIFNYLVEYMDTHNAAKKVKVNKFLNFIAGKRSLDSSKKLHVRIHNLGFFINDILQAKSLENAKDTKYPPDVISQSKNSSPVVKSCDQINGSTSFNKLNCIERKNKLNKKRKADEIVCTSDVSQKLPKIDGTVQGSSGDKLVNKHLANVVLHPNSMMTFIKLWRDKCKTVPEAMEQMLMFYKSDNPEISTEVAARLYTSYPLVGLINIAIRSIKHGMWDNQHVTFDSFKEFKQKEELILASKGLSDGNIETEQELVLPCLNAYISHQLLELLVAQASHSLLENENLSIQNVEDLLTKQFPLIPFNFDKQVSLKAVADVVEANRSNPVSKSVVFSAALLLFRNVNSYSETHISSEVAIEVLTRAPMLSDLNTWSHWDLLFAPSFGPLTLFLLNETNVKELLCLVTRTGNVIRIDHTATVDSFLEASANMSSFQTALNLLSLFALYGGEKNVPSSLLKCHAEKAFKVNLSKDKSQLKDGISSASKFVLECLTFLPREFRCFATDLLLSGFRSVVKDASSAILRDCRHVEEHLMLHELGLSLGIMEWIDDYKTFSVSEYNQENDLSVSYSPAEGKGILVQKDECKVVKTIVKPMDLIISNNEEDPAKIIESIRQEEFGLDPNISVIQDSILKKQHARLGRALQCLSQELYSQDSHFLLELVQNADDNVYPCDVEPTLTFILQEEGVIVLNNEQGFSVENIKALCDVGNSTKKEANAGYIGKKGIGFKSVFRVTDAPQIHSNGFHIKFDISDGQIGFVLPTVVPPCDVNLFSKLASVDNDPTDEKHWNTCIVLPFKSTKLETENLISMFSDLHPSLLLFLHRLKCIKFRNLLNDAFVVMKKEVVEDDIVNVFHGNQKMTWFVKSCKLEADHIRNDVKSTEISMAFMLKDLNNGNYIPKLDHQPVFAFLPLRNYGLKFIIQADFILPSSREEVDGNSPWNQWLLSEFPNLFVNAELSFCSLPCFKENPAKGISVFMSFVPLGGEVYGFFSCLPRMIISKLRVSNCLLLEGDINEWVPPCKVVRNWTEQIRSLLPDNLIKEHLDVGYLNKDTVLTDSLARALGVEECGPKILVQVMTSLCRAGSLKSMGLEWLSSWLNVLYLTSVNGTQPDIISSLSQLPFIPLLDGNYASISDGAIWLHTDPEYGLELFRELYLKLRIVNPGFFNDSHAENITHMLYKIGVQRLSAHEVLKVNILPAISDEKVRAESKELMSEYLCFIMFHLDSPCNECRVEREHILTKLHNNAFISTNGGYKRLVDVPIHFSKEFGNTVDMNKLVNGTAMNWFEIDTGYLKHPVFKSSPGGTLKLRKFLQDLGITDFVQIVKVEKLIEDIPHTTIKKMMLDDECISSGSTVIDYDSQELTNLLSHVSSNGDREKNKYLLKVLNRLWNDYFSDKITGSCTINGKNKHFKSSVLRILHDVQWLVSSMDNQLHFPKELFHNCETVREVLGDMAPYAVPKVKCLKFLKDIGLKTLVNLDDAFAILKVWRTSKKPFKARSISQMCNFYTFICNKMSISKQKIVDNLHSEAFIFVPYSFGSTDEPVSGSFLSPSELYWHDSTGSMEQIKSIYPKFDRCMTHCPFSKILCNIYPSLHYFFVKEFGVAEEPPLLCHLQSLQQLSIWISPSQAANTVFLVFEKWSDGLESGVLSSDDIDYLKKKMGEKEMRILPTVQNKWVSLHQSFGLICWCDDEQKKMEFNNLKNIDFILLGCLTTQEKQILQDKISLLFSRLGIPSLSEVVTREVIYNDPIDSSYKTALVRWALPYAQRYIYNIHQKEYSKFKLSGLINLNGLKIVVVKKLFYKNVIKRSGIESNKQYECSCLLQDNILYATSESDTHSLYMELSRFLLGKIPELPLANFLHMIAVMAKSGSTKEDIEVFIAVNQKLLKLPSEESQWSILSNSDSDEDLPTTNSGFPLEKLVSPPEPTAKKTRRLKKRKAPPGTETAIITKEAKIAETKQEGLVESKDQIIEEDPALKDQSDSGVDINVDLKGQLDNGKNTVSSDINAATTRNDEPTATLIGEDQLCLATITPKQVKKKRKREVVALESVKLGDISVKQVNGVKDSGLPCDIVAEVKDGTNEAKIIESIRREEFGLDPNMSAIENSILKKQHARLGRALQCLSQELYSQDSHFILELVQNADDNVYPCDVEPTLTFILKEEGVIVLNNEQGFSVENIKALCDIGNSTKKEANVGYIGKKGIGFKSVFRVTDAPEIHSNGFHIKFDISDGQIGFVLPTVVPPCDVNLFSKLASVDNDPTDEKSWNTCIVLPFQSNKTEAFSIENLISMFSNLHPSLLLFLHRLKCIKFRNILNDSLTVMRKEVVGDGIVNVSFGNEKMTWFVKSRKLKPKHIRNDVKSTEISMAFMLEVLDNGNYIPKLDQQPVFAFLPLRNYGLKFIIQADFILPSSREEVDGDSPWNRWLLSEFPNLFVSAELSFCSLPCFKENPAKGVSVFMSFVPLGGEVQGFFARLPRLIISKLLVSNCLLLEGDSNEWVPPCKVLRNWTEETRSLLPDSLIKEHLGLGYLNKDTVLTDSLARALHIEECGPKVLVQVMTALCRAGSLKSMGLSWLSSWLNVLYLMLLNGNQSDIISSIVQLPFIPLSDGNYASINDGAIWLHSDHPEHGLEAFEKLYPNLRIVDPAIFNDSPVENITQMLYKVGVQRLSAHEVVKVHILPVISDTTKTKELMIEYLTYVMFHLYSPCTECCVEREHILTQLHSNAFISTNRGYKRLLDVPIHFSKEFGNPIDMNKLIYGSDMNWFEIDIGYLKHPAFKSSPEGTLKWRKFFQDLGITDFVQIVKVEKRIEDISHANIKKMMLDDECISSGSTVIDYDSQELTNLLSHVSSTGDREKSIYLLEVVDTLWDDYFSDKVRGFCIVNGEKKPFKSCVTRILNSVRWLASSMDDQLHFPQDLLHNCETVLAVLGETAPYVIPKITSVKLLDDIGLKDTITLDDALSLVQVWTRSEIPFKASISQMSKLYTYIWNEMSISKQKIVDSLHSQPFIFVPDSFGIGSAHEVVSGSFLSPNEVYWHDSIGSMEQTKSTDPQHATHSKMLCNIYPSLRYFFVDEFGVAENPPLLSYLHLLQQLSTGTLPSQAAKTVFHVFQKWSDGLESDDIDYLKKKMEEKETRILPTMEDKWVSLHESFGLLCWPDDEELRKEFKNLNNINFLFLGDLNTEETQMLHNKVSVLLHKLEIPSLSEVVTREAIYSDPTFSRYKTSLVNWALPFAQRYIYSIHPNKYSEFKLSAIQNLEVVEVGNLRYKNVIKRFGIESSQQHKCGCILDSNVLYATCESDSHPLFMELSRLLLAGIPQLHLANFLHVITTMAISGFTDEKMEDFITNSQKLLKLPDQEPLWSILSASASLNRKQAGKNWPPVHWKTPTKEIIEEIPALSTPLVIMEKDDEPCNISSVGFKDEAEKIVTRCDGPISGPQMAKTGRIGEEVAYKYFCEKLGEKCVKWVNEEKESHLPYDIVVEGEDNSKEYIEVKATTNARKNWFEVSVNEWQCALEKRDSFSIARVVLSYGKLDQVVTYKDPVKLCQSGHLDLQLKPVK